MELDDDWTGSVELKIALDHPQGVFYPGNQVAGKVLVSWNEPKIFLGLRVKCEGTGLVFFTDRSAGFRRKFSNDESYLAREVYLIGDGESPVSTEGGQNEFPFSIDLPEEIPGSFEGRYGRVRYSVSAFLDLTNVVRITSSLPFTVVPVLDLNQDSLATLPISEDNSKVVVGQTEPLNMLVTLPVRGFVPGQTIPVKIVLNNVSNVEIRKLRVVFKKVITYHTHRKSRRHKEIIVEIELPVTKSCQVYETGVDVPAVPPTGLKFCSIIDVWYTLKVEACVEVNEWYLRMLQKNLKTRMRIVVGTIPLRHYETPEEELPGEGTGRQTEVGNIGEKPKTDDFAENPSLYEQSKIYPSSKPNRDDPPGDEEAENGSGNTYAPLYRVYTFNKSKRNNHSSKSNH
ncbi:arrestin domain-containing protein 17 [Neodiprion pinetum]|uniref:arrestin domain-containing protein 17 n=1 Tax=Neodiprion pinetum TaxID=441929 RepID=UPI001EDDD5B2|nr:arrestin domain-containing protein 17-like [Neodiprion pinetum]